ncbi:hypothetical protein B0H14DRAFT_3437779 [Mycena olivaceomarginata]|nr:hypothetical protein B0H14DRAFT_3437779 [Mycena olivaceomarginata]
MNNESTEGKHVGTYGWLSMRRYKLVFHDNTHGSELHHASQANIVESGGDVDLGDFFGATPAPDWTSAAPPSNGPATPVSKGKGKARNASPGPSVSPLDAAAKQFIDDLNLPEIPPHDKRFDGKNETRGLGVGLQSPLFHPRICGGGRINIHVLRHLEPAMVASIWHERWDR